MPVRAGYSQAQKAKKVRRSMSYSPSSYGRAMAKANESASPSQFAITGPTAGAESSYGPTPIDTNPPVGFAVKKEYTEVRIDLLEAENRLSEAQAQIQNEALQLQRTNLAH